jgi:hypothetical protein
MSVVAKSCMLILWLLLLLMRPDRLMADGLGFKMVLPNQDGESTTFSATSDARLRVFCFLGCECPLARLYGARLSELSERFVQEGVHFIGVNSNLQDSIEEVKRYFHELKLAFPVYKDHDQRLMKALAAKRTPEVIVLDGKGAIIYRGRIDDQYQPGLNRGKPAHRDLEEAIVAHLAAKPIDNPQTDAFGCLITIRNETVNDSKVTYCNQVSRILSRHCVECHQAGEIGPFALTDYSEVIGWTDMLVETIEQKRMPPWHANPAHGDFVNARSVPKEDLQQLLEWKQSGAPYGDPSDLPLKTEITQRNEAQVDQVIPMRDKAFPIASEGTVEYQYFVVDPGFQEDRWIRHAKLVPSNRSVVHHGIVFTRPPDGVAMHGIGWLTAYVPGQADYPAPAHRARWVPAGSKLVFQMHYTPTGKPEEDLSELHITFADPSEVTEEHLTLASFNQDLEIPAGKDDVAIDGRLDDLPRRGKLLALSPHMHLRGKSMAVETVAKGQSTTILDVPRYDFNWQHIYIPRQPIDLDTIDHLRFTARFDNSDKNPHNPDPKAFVTWGEQTWEEMGIVFYEVAVPREPTGNEDKMASTPKPAKPTTPTAKQAIHRQQAKELMAIFDRNGDQKAAYDEVDEVVQFRSFRRYDLNGDRIIELHELEESLRRMNR